MIQRQEPFVFQHPQFFSTVRPYRRGWIIYSANPLDSSDYCRLDSVEGRTSAGRGASPGLSYEKHIIVSKPVHTWRGSLQKYAEAYWSVFIVSAMILLMKIGRG